MRRFTFAALTLTLLALIACDDDSDTTGLAGGQQSSSSAGGGAGAGGSGGNGVACAAVGPEVHTFDTDDGVTLEADLYTTGQVAGPGVVLLHMIPPNFDRTSYSSTFIGKLTDAGLNVLNIDRRGAGNSGGVASQAYTGPNGKLDVKAAVDFLSAHPCAIDASRIAVVGASNGTTSALDYAVFATGDASAAVPSAMVFLTGGDYTEAQNNLAGAGLDALPLLFVYSNTENAWSIQFEAGAAAVWVFSEYNPGSHGSTMLTNRPESMDEVATFLAAQL